MRLITLGTGNAFAEGSRFHSATIVKAGRKTLLVDCGPCIMPALNRAGITSDEIDAVLITHFHGDHIGGVPLLLLDCRFRSRRTRPLLILGPRRCKAHLEALTKLMYRELVGKRRGFPVTYKEIMPGDEGLVLGGIVVRAYGMRHIHRKECLGYRIEDRGKSVAITGDTTWCDSIPEMSRAVDLLLTECTQFTQENPVHLSYAQLLKHDAEIGAKRIVLTHLGGDLLKNRARIRRRHRIAEDGEAFDV